MPGRMIAVPNGKPTLPGRMTAVPNGTPSMPSRTPAVRAGSGAPAGRPGRARGLALLLAAGSTGCSLGTGVACTAIAVPGLQLAVRDSVTQVPAGHGATAAAQDGGYQETLFYLGSVSGFDSLTFSGAVERAGTYSIRVTKPGYHAWTRANVTVTRDECHVIPAQLDVRLQPGTDPTAPGS